MPILSFYQTLTCGITGTTLASGIKFPDGARNVTVYVPSLTSGTDIGFYVSHNDSSYKRLKYSPLSGTVAPGNVTIGSAASNAAFRINELQGQAYVKTEVASANTSADLTFVYTVEY